MTDYVFKRKNRNKINPGDLFSFRLDDNSWGFGRIVSRITDGHVAEIFKYFANEPVLDSGKTYDRFMPPVVLDAYSLFQLKREGDWGFVGSTPDYAPDAVIAQVRFAWGSSGDQKATDIYDKYLPVSDQEAKSLPRCQPWGDYDVKEFIKRSLANS
jgi:Immunity protein 26